MAADLGDLVARLRVETGSLDEAVGKIHSFGSLATTGVAVVGAALLAVGTASAVMAEKYQSATDAMAAKAGITQDAAKKIGDAFLNTAFQSTFSAQTIMTAYGPVSGQLALVAGHSLSAAEAMGVMTAASNLAEATGGNLASTTAALAGVMQAYRIPLAGAATASDVLFNTSRSLNIPVGDLANTVDRLHAKLGPLSPSLADTSSLLVDLASHGLTGSRALMLVSTGFSTLLSGSKPVNAEVSKLGLTLYDAQGKFVGMQSVISQLGPKLAGMTEQQRLLAEKTLFGAGAGKALDDTLMAGVAGYNAAAAAATKTGTAQQGAKTATDNLKGAFDRATAGVQDLLVRIGDALIPVLTTVVNWFSGSVVPALEAFWKTIQDHMPAIQEGFRVFGQVVATVFTVVKNIITVAVQVIVQVITVLVHVIQGIVTVVSAVVSVVATVIGVLVNIFKVAASVIGAVIGVLVAIIGGIVTAISAVVHWSGWGTIVSIFKVPFDIIGGIIGAISSAIGAIIQGLKDVLGWSGWGTIGGIFGSVFGGIATVIGGVVTAIEDIVTGIKDVISWLGSLGGAGSGSHQPAGGSAAGNIARSGGWSNINHRALGGPVVPGMATWVGERGREIFTPSVPGYITPNNMLPTGGVNLTVYVTQSNASAEDIAAAISWKLRTAA